MTGGTESAAGDKDGVPTLTTQIPVGWQRKVEDGAVAYISPSGTILCSLEEVKVYLLTDNTCKCGLECPLVLHKVFNFDPGTVVLMQDHQQPGKPEEDMTKLCNHRRKVVAMAALCRSMQISQGPLPAHGPGIIFCLSEDRDQKGISIQPRPLTPTKSNSHSSCGAKNSFPLPLPLTLMQNGSVSHSSPLALDCNLLSKKHTPQHPGSSVTGYGKQWYPHSADTQPATQRPLHSPALAKPGVHLHSYSLVPTLSPSSAPLSSSLPFGGKAGQSPFQGTSVKTSPLSVCPSPSQTLDSTSPHQQSRHSSASSLSELGPGLSLATYPQGSKPPCPSLSPLSSTTACTSPKGSLCPASPQSCREGMLQLSKDCAKSSSTNPSTNYTQLHQRNLSSFQEAQNLHLPPYTSDRKNGPSVNTPISCNAGSLLSVPLGQLFNQQKKQQQVASFPASSLLTAAAKAQLASQKSQTSTTSICSTIPSTGLDKETQQSTVLISTLNNSVHRPQTRPQSMTAFLLPHTPSRLQAPVSLIEKSSQRKRQQRSPTVLSMLKESQLNSLRPGGSPSTSVSTPNLSSSTSPKHIPVVPAAMENHLQTPRLPGTPNYTPLFSSSLKLPDSEEAKKTGLPQPLNALLPSQPLSALLQLLSLQNSTQSVSSPASSGASHTRPVSTQSLSPGLTVSQPPQYDSQPLSHLLTTQQSQSLVASVEVTSPQSSSQAFAAMAEMDGTSANLKPCANGILNLSQFSAGSTPASLQTEFSSQILSLMGQLTSGSCLPALGDKMCGGSDHSVFQLNQSHGADSEGTVVSVNPPDPAETRLSGACDSEPDLSLPPATADSSSSLQLAESFPFMNQEQLLQLLSPSNGLPSLLPPFLGSLPIGLWTGNQLTVPSTTQQQQQQQQQTGPLNQASQLNVFSSVLGAQGDFPVSLISLLNPPLPPPVVALSAQGQAVDVGEKSPGLPALLMASLLLSQQQAATMVPLPGLGQLNMDIPVQQQQFAQLQDGVSMEKAPGPLDSLLTCPGLFEALQGLASLGEGSLHGPQSLLLSAPLTPPAFLSLSPALLAAALGPAEPLPNPQQPPLTQSQGTPVSPSLGSTSVSCAPVLPSTVPEVVDTLASVTEQEKGNSPPSQLLSPLLHPGVLGDLAALGNMNHLQGLVGTSPLLLPQVQASALGMPLPPGQGSLNPLACILSSLQLTVGPTLSVGEKPLDLNETTTSASQEDLPVTQLSQELLPNSGLMQATEPPQQEASDEPLFDPYASFMDTIYTSFLQVSGKGSEGLAGGQPAAGGMSGPLSYSGDLTSLVPQPSAPPSLAPPSLSPRRACSVHNPNPSHLSIEAAQSPARGTPKLREDATSTPPPSKPGDSEGCGDVPLAFSFMEEAKTDMRCVYSNGVALELLPGTEENEEDKEPGLHPQRLPPRAKVENEGADGSTDNTDMDQERVPGTRGGVRRGRKRKQILEKGPGDMDSFIEEPAATIALPKPMRSTRGKRRRVVR
ncbi:methyl-CpG-binding domain protein 6 [Chanos chanos]|uniref:Methyl-CpG-binding domain protein 6 n=1 Tax=Chanos chanos TaxID=29144 RepID=A0A6J2VJT4_CHACN|nr:methyl-CpG-binding domain protein 6 [Chanos chanos]